MNTWWFDGHLHIMSEKRMKSGIRWAIKAGFDMGLEPEQTTEDTLLQQIRNTGIRYFFNFFFPIFPRTTLEILNWQTQFALRTPEAFPFVSVHVNDGDPLPFVEEALERRRFVGLKLHPYAQRLALSHPLLEPVYDYVEKKGAIFVTHTGYDAFYGQSGITQDLEKILEDHPQLITVVAHMLYPEMDKAFEWLERFPNLYLDGTNVIYSAAQDGTIGRLYPLLEKYADRILFGSDYAMAMEPIGSTWKRFAELPISEEAKIQIGQKTPLQLLRRSGWPFRGEAPISYREVVEGQNASHNSSSVR
ncbi:MAG: hypothetical protein BAA01_16635 [Bacillus thermozeamaize]|uniref:Amidohydrolase-related domain-containing protein n=1 Tax=Bacillus thermozeamaize TaxID=230954 RepID=A0A1Y3PI26_9BACI|nr:MAG: hypothetical protein BAA01_16635 [Bacillus thermozeamaize]